MTPGERAFHLTRIHHAIAQVSGGLAIAMVRAKGSRSDVEKWIAILRDSADALEKIIKQEGGEES